MTKKPNPFQPWHGGECPCTGQVVELEFRNGNLLRTHVPEREDWEHLGQDDDIKGWRAVA